MTEIARTLWGAAPTISVPATIVIAEGTIYETLAYDARQLGPWATETGGGIDAQERMIVYHHTVEPEWGGQGWEWQLKAMRAARDFAPWGLPYNFIVFPTGRGRVWYLNDVDKRWPHTYNNNGACAIAAWGNFSVQRPTPRLVDKMLRLADALATMWGREMREFQHRDVQPTECPGNFLAPKLPAWDRQRPGSAGGSPF